MLVARADDREVHVDDYDAAVKTDLRCKCCDAEVVAKKGQVKVHHYAHKKGAACDDWRKGYAMTEWHKRWQSLCVPESLETRIQRGDKWHIADIVNLDGTVLEVQHSNIAGEAVAEREKFYGDMIWILDGRTGAKARVLSQGDNWMIVEGASLFWGHLSKPAYADTVAGMGRLSRRISGRSWLLLREDGDIFFERYFSGILRGTRPDTKDLEARFSRYPGVSCDTQIPCRWITGRILPDQLIFKDWVVMKNVSTGRVYSFHPDEWELREGSPEYKDLATLRLEKLAEAVKRDWNPLQGGPFPDDAAVILKKWGRSKISAAEAEERILEECRCRRRTALQDILTDELRKKIGSDELADYQIFKAEAVVDWIPAHELFYSDIVLRRYILRVSPVGDEEAKLVARVVREFHGGPKVTADMVFSELRRCGIHYEDMTDLFGRLCKDVRRKALDDIDSQVKEVLSERLGYRELPPRVKHAFDLIKTTPGWYDATPEALVDKTLLNCGGCTMQQLEKQWKLLYGEEPFPAEMLESSKSQIDYVWDKEVFKAAIVAAVRSAHAAVTAATVCSPRVPSDAKRQKLAHGQITLRTYFGGQS